MWRFVPGIRGRLSFRKFTGENFFPEGISGQEFEYITDLYSRFLESIVLKPMLNFRHWQAEASLPILFIHSVSAVILLQVPAMSVPVIVPVQAGDNQHWARTCLDSLTQRQILTSVDAANPNATVSRAEYAIALQRAFPQLRPTQHSVQFRDVRFDHPAFQAIQYIQQRGFLIGPVKDEFKPAAGISRSQAFGGIASGLRYTAKQVASQDLRALFKDGRMVPDYAQGAIAAALENRLIINYPDPQRLNPNQPITRRELAASLCQAILTPIALVPPQYIASLKPPHIVPVSITSPSSSLPPFPSSPLPLSPIPPNSIIISVPNPPTPTPPPSTMPPRVPTQEIRASWLTNIDSYILFNARLLRDGMQELAQLKFNTVYPVVWNWGYTQYPSAVAQRETGHAIDPRPAGLQGRDPLLELTRLGRLHNIAVIPWFEFGFMSTAESELVARRPDWLTQRQDGSKIWQEGQYQRVWLNPFKPEVQQFILDLILEVVTQYDIDGIQFDDHMGLPSDFGYDPYTIALYKKENPGKEPPKNPKDPAWLRWRADKITEFMGRMVRTIKARKPYITVALSPNAQKFSYENYLQDWVTWRRKGYVDELLLQVYRSDINSFVNELMQPEVQEAKQYIPVGVGILTGLNGKPIPIAQVQEQVQAARALGFVGVSFFFYETMWNLTDESPELRKQIFQDLFTPAVPRPNLVGGWRAEP